MGDRNVRSDRLREILADGQWHPAFEVARKLAIVVPPGEAERLGRKAVGRDEQNHPESSMRPLTRDRAIIRGLAAAVSTTIRGAIRIGWVERAGDGRLSLSRRSDSLLRLRPVAPGPADHVVARTLGRWFHWPETAARNVIARTPVDQLPPHSHADHVKAKWKISNADIPAWCLFLANARIRGMSYETQTWIPYDRTHDGLWDQTAGEWVRDESGAPMLKPTDADRSGV